MARTLLLLLSFSLSLFSIRAEAARPAWLQKTMQRARSALTRLKVNRKQMRVQRHKAAVLQHELVASSRDYRRLQAVRAEVHHGNGGVIRQMEETQRLEHRLAKNATYRQLKRVQSQRLETFLWSLLRGAP